MIKNTIFIFVVLVAVFVLYLPSYLQMQDLRGRNEAAERRIKDLEAENSKFTIERERLKNDPEYFEKVARQRMGLIKEGEVIYKVVPPGGKTPEPVEEVKKPDAAKIAVKKKILKKASKNKAKDVKKPVDKSAADKKKVSIKD
ncbi:MAG: septum formation initiator family protein [Candidatus Omnitrophota bacterium]